ncbi:MAG: hypothetical protein ACYCWW_11520 [Deltaproteobacteria bacterium]
MALWLSACQGGGPIAPPSTSGPYVGTVTLAASPTSNGVLANFTTPTFAPAAGSCPGTMQDGCCVYAQPQIDIPAGGVEPVTVSAGTLTIVDGSQPIGSFEFASFGYVPLSSAVSPTLFWKSGDGLGVAASGGVVTPFSGSVVAPPPFEGVSPALSPSGQLLILLASDLTVTWSPPPLASGEVTAELFDVAGFYVDCAAQDSAGSLTFPASTFGGIASGDTGTLTLTRTATAAVAASNATVTLTAEATAVGNVSFH